MILYYSILENTQATIFWTQIPTGNFNYEERYCHSGSYSKQKRENYE